MVLGAGGPAADNYIKSLRLADPGIYVLGVDTHPLMLELSCATETAVLETRPVRGEAGFDHVRELMILKDEHGITMIHAQPDEEALFVALWSDQLPVSTADGGRGGMIESCQDKLRCAELLGDLAPRSLPYYSGEDGWRALADWWPPHGSGLRWMRARTGAGSLAAKSVDSAGAAHDWASVWRGRVSRADFMLSEYLPGEDRSYTGVWWRGEPVASACRVRVEYADTRTPSGQCSSPRIAKLDSRPETFDTAEAAIRRVSEATGTVPHGVFYVDMREAADGRLLVTEINAGRFNTTQNFYAECGMNLPFVHARLHHGDVYPSDASARLEPLTDVYWVRQPDMGHKLVAKTKVPA